MPQIANVVINDGAGSPVAHTFSPIGRDDKTGVFWFEQTIPAPASPLAAKRIGYKQVRAVSASTKKMDGVGKVSYMLSVPTLEVLGTSDNGIVPPPTLAYKEVARLEFEIAERSTTQERKDTRVLAMNLLANAMAIANVDTLQPSYS